MYHKYFTFRGMQYIHHNFKTAYDIKTPKQSSYGELLCLNSTVLWVRLIHANSITGLYSQFQTTTHIYSLWQYTMHSFWYYVICQCNIRLIKTNNKQLQHTTANYRNSYCQCYSLLKYIIDIAVHKQRNHVRYSHFKYNPVYGKTKQQTVIMQQRNSQSCLYSIQSSILLLNYNNYIIINDYNEHRQSKCG